MRKLLLFTLAIILVLVTSLAAQGAEKFGAIPEALRAELESTSRTQGKKESYVYIETIQTSQPSVDAEIKALTESFDAKYSSALKPDKSQRPLRNSRLDINCIYAISGDRWMSVMSLARVSYKRKQQSIDFATRTYDMITGARVTLGDMFSDDSEGWNVLREEACRQYTAYFPDTAPDAAALEALLSDDALRTAEFMVGATSLTLCCKASALYSDRPTMIYACIDYRLIRPYMTQEAAAQTDNSHYKMAALTFDDGPSYENSASVINALRNYGALGTFFLVGNRISEYEDTVQREHDQMHALASHGNAHANPSKLSAAGILKSEQRMRDALVAVTGRAPALARAPYGLYNDLIKADVHMPLVQWSIDTYDWRGGNSNGVLSKVKKAYDDGAIILLHDIKDNTGKSTQLICEYLMDHGYLLVTVDDLFRRAGIEPPINTVVYRCTEDGQINLPK